MKNFEHLMIDLETMGTESKSSIVSIGAVEFDIKTGETGREFYKRIDLQSCLNNGLIVNGSTIYWWLLQNENARKEIAKGGDDLTTVLCQFGTFMHELLPNIQIWGNGVRFDLGLLEDACIACGFTIIPWNFRLERDVRTLVSLAPSIKEKYIFNGTTHNPIDDCKYQIKYCSAIYQKIMFE